MERLQKAILRTLVYADIFDYCLSSGELHRFLIIKNSPSFSSFKEALTLISADSFDFAQDKFPLIDADKGYFFLKGRKKIVKTREEREKRSKEKIKIARRIGGWFKFIPWVKMVGITGALAMANANKEDDIDLIIVTAKNRLWLTRFFLILLSEILGVRRRPGSCSASWRNKICLNMFLDEAHLMLPVGERNLYTAHEVCQVRLIWDRDDTFRKFLWENLWASKFLPNAVKINSKLKVKISKLQFNNIIFNFLEKIAYKFQLFYMKPKRTIEKVAEGRVLFHPGDCSRRVMGEYNNGLIKLKSQMSNLKTKSQN